MRLTGILLSFLFAAIGAAVLLPSSAGADTTNGPADLVAEASATTTSVVTNTTEVPLICRTSEVPYLQNGRRVSGQFTYTYVDARYWRYEPATGRSWIRSYEVCTRGGEPVSNNYIWELISQPNPEIVADDLYDRAVRDIDPPVPALSPVGPGVINLGMWLAVNDPGEYSVTATVPGLSVTVTAQLAETRFDMGNGDIVTCPGAGDPIPEAAKDDVAPSSVCGYTYQSRPEDRSVSITMTSTWTVSWTSSQGGSGTRPAISKTSSVEYEILEIQTVGRSNG